jgi:hypothetical protein
VAALRAALLRNNLLVDVKLDAVSLVIPNKRLYEVIYNRVGNDLLLWVPTYLAVKEKRTHPYRMKYKYNIMSVAGPHSL